MFHVIRNLLDFLLLTNHDFLKALVQGSVFFAHRGAEGVNRWFIFCLLQLFRYLNSLLVITLLKFLSV